MPEIKLRARIQNKYETLEEWSQLNKGDFIPLLGEVCYGIENELLYQKIGDGETDFIDLPWLLNQADNEINDETSPAYIKNRLAYLEYTEVPESEQILYTDEIVSEELDTKEMLLELFTDEQVKSYVDTSFNDTNNIFIGTTEITGPTELIQNQFNKLFINIYTAINGKISCDFNSENKLQSDSTIEGYSVFCFGNTHWANIITNIFFETVDTPILYYPQDNISTEKYSVVLIGPLPEDDMETYFVFVVFDNDIYPCQEEDTDGALLYKYPYDIQLLMTGQIHTIDDKYLGDIKSDFDELKSSSKNYIKNRPGINTIIDITDEYATELGQYYSTITAGPYVSPLGQALYGENVHEDFADPDLMHTLETCTVVIDGQTWYNCPVFQRTIVGSSNTRNAYYIGNPIYISNNTKTQLDILITSGEGSMVKGYNIYEEIDNDLPFVIPYCPGSATPLYDGGYYEFPKHYEKGDTFSIKIIPERIRVTTNVIRKDVLPQETIIGILNNDLNSILLNSAYEASGANSLAAGYGTKATNSEAIALGKATEASGRYALSLGDNTKAQGTNSLAGGTSTSAIGDNSIALGEGSITKKNNSFAFGSCIETTYSSFTIQNNVNVLLATLNRTDYNQIRLYYKPTDSSAYVYTPWLNIYNIYTSDSQYRIHLESNLSEYNSDFTKFTSIQLRKTNYTQENNGIAFGVANRAKGIGSTAFGYDNTAESAYSFVVGKNNEIGSEAFIIGNGSSNDNRSNAMKVDWEGNVNVSGDLIGKSLSFNSELSILGTDKYLDLSTTKTDELTVQIQSSSSSDTDLSIYQGEIHNKNWWPLTGWDLATDSKGTGTVLDDGSYQLTYTNGSVIVFNVDGSISLDYVEGDTLSIALSTNKSSCHLPAGNFILSNGIDANCGIKLYAKSTANETEDGTLPGISPVCQLAGKTALGVRTASGTTSFSTTFYPQLEMVDEESINRTAYVVPQVDRFYFNTDGTYTINVTKYLSQWEKPSFIFPDSSTTRTIKGYYFNDINKIPYIDSIISEGRKEKQYIIDLKNLGDYGSFVVDTNGDNASFALTIKLGVKNNNTDSWIPYLNNITSEQLAIVDLYSDAFKNSLGEYLNGYKLSNGYLINTSDIWSISTEDFKDLLTNILDAQFESGSVRLRKNIIGNVEYCELYYNMYFYSASDEIKEIFNVLAMADKFITFLPEGYENIYVN